MALPATGVIEVRTTATASNLNGGGFNAARGGTDYTLQNAAQLTATDGSAAGTTTFTSVTGGFTTAMEGNYIHLTASTGLTVGWYEIVTRTDTNNVVLDRSPGTGTATTYYVGGALSLGSSDDAVFEMLVPGNTMYVKAGTYTIGGTVTIATVGTLTEPINVVGYNATRTDAPTGSTRPVFACGAVVFTAAAWWNWRYLVFTGTGTSVLSSGASNHVINCKTINTSATAARAGFITAATGVGYRNCEAISTRGYAFQTSAASVYFGCWAHDSDVGLRSSAITAATYDFCLSSANVTAAVDVTGASDAYINNCTLLGSPTTKRGVGIRFAATTESGQVGNTTISGFVTGLTTVTAAINIYSDYNNLHNNTTDRTNWVAVGANEIALDPAFTSVTERSGSTATTTAGNHLVQSGATFTTWGIVAGQDYVYISGGTGVTAGVYDIASVDSETQITTTMTLTANATADKTWFIVQGNNFAPGANMKAVANPGVFPGALTTGYLDIGAVQRIEGSGGGGIVKMAGNGGGFVG